MNGWKRTHKPPNDMRIRPDRRIDNTGTEWRARPRELSWDRLDHKGPLRGPTVPPVYRKPQKTP